MSTFPEQFNAWWKIVATVIGCIVAVVIWHYTQFQTVEAADIRWEAMEQSTNTQTLVILKKELREYESELSILADTPANAARRAWLEVQIREIKETIACIRNGGKVC